MKVRNLLSGFLAAIITVLVVVSIADGGEPNGDYEAPRLIDSYPKPYATLTPEELKEKGMMLRFSEPVVFCEITLTNLTTKKGIPGLRVEPWDKDIVFDDLVGSATTDEGVWELNVTAWDKAGNKSETTITFSVVLKKDDKDKQPPDTEPPCLVWSDPKDGDTVELAKGQPLEVKLFFSEPVYCEATLTNLTTGEEYDNITHAPLPDTEIDSLSAYLSACLLARDNHHDVQERIDLHDRDAPISVCLDITAWDEAKNESEFTITFYVVLKNDDEDEE